MPLNTKGRSKQLRGWQRAGRVRWVPLVASLLASAVVQPAPVLAQRDPVHQACIDIIKGKPAKIIYFWFSRGWIEGQGFVRYIVRPASYVLLSGPKFAGTLAAGGPPALLATVKIDAVHAMSKTILDSPDVAARRIASRSFHDGLEAYRFNYRLYHQFRDSPELFPAHLADEFFRNGYKLGLMAAAKQLYGAVTDEQYDDPFRTVNAAKRQTADVALEALATAAAVDQAYSAGKYWAAQKRILKATDVGLFRYPPYLEYAQEVERLTRDYEKALSNLRQPARSPQQFSETPQSPRPVSPHAGPGSTIIAVVDGSGSMLKGEDGHRPAIEEVRRAMDLVLGMLSPEDRFGLVVFSDRARVVRPPAAVESSRLAVLSALTNVPGGGTNFQAALTAAKAVLGTVSSETAAVLFLSDGKSECARCKSLVAEIRNLGAVMHAVPVGGGADPRTVCSLARDTEGVCIPATAGGLKQALGRLATRSRGLTELAALQDVIRPGEAQEAYLRLPISDKQGDLQLTGTWPGSDIEFTALSPSGHFYSTHGSQPSASRAGNANVGFRLLRVPYEHGPWKLTSIGRDVSPMGEPYSLSVAAPVDGIATIRPVHERYPPGSSAVVEVERCPSTGVQIQLHTSTTPSAPVHAEARGTTCRVALQLPAVSGVFPISVLVPGNPPSTLWTSAAVGSPAEIVGTRDTWRPSRIGWAQAAAGTGDGAGALLVFGLALAGAALASRRGRRGTSRRRQSRGRR